MTEHSDLAAIGNEQRLGEAGQVDRVFHGHRPARDPHRPDSRARDRVVERRRERVAKLTAAGERAKVATSAAIVRRRRLARTHVHAIPSARASAAATWAGHNRCSRSPWARNPRSSASPKRSVATPRTSAPGTTTLPTTGVRTARAHRSTHKAPAQAAPSTTPSCSMFSTSSGWSVARSRLTGNPRSLLHEGRRRVPTRCRVGRSRRRTRPQLPCGVGARQVVPTDSSERHGRRAPGRRRSRDLR